MIKIYSPLNVYYSSRLDYLVPGAYKRVLIRSNAHALCVHVLYAYICTTMGAYFVVYVRLHLYTHATYNDMTIYRKTRYECDVLIT